MEFPACISMDGRERRKQENVGNLSKPVNQNSELFSQELFSSEEV